MVYKAKRVASEESRTYFTILRQDDDGDMVLWNYKNNWDQYLFTTTLMEAKRFATEEEALIFISKELKGSSDSYKVITVKIEVSIGNHQQLNNF